MEILFLQDLSTLRFEVFLGPVGHKLFTYLKHTNMPLETVRQRVQKLLDSGLKQAEVARRLQLKIVQGVVENGLSDLIN